jgi:cytochrome oxidase Cu insertion factor (SCO1/SenC/PrrC family)
VSGPGPSRSQRRTLIVLALLFFAPLALAFYLYYGLAWRPGGRVNHGDLIEPPRPLPELALPVEGAGGARAGQGATVTRPDFLKGKWTLLYVGPGGCAARCQTELYNTRQVRTALGRDMSRVQRVFIADGSCCDGVLLAQHADLIVVQATPAAAALLDELRGAGGGGAQGSDPRADRVYLIDPLGNLMMSYAPDAPAKGMLQDLKRLLNLSSVG